MNKKPKKSLIIIIIIAVLLLLLLILCSLIVIGVIALKRTQAENSYESVEDYYARIAENNPEVSYEEGYCFVNNKIIVSMNDASKKEEIEATYSCTGEPLFGDNYSFYCLVFDEKLSYNEVETIIEELNSKDYVDKAWINDVLALDNNSLPKDPWGGDNWDVSNPSGNNWGLEAINMPKAWKSFDSDTKVKIGIIDSGIDKDHEDLKNNIVNTTTEEEDSHGTEVAGIIGAEWNDIGISGIVGNNCELYEVYAYENVIISSEYTSLEKEISYFTWLLDYCDVQVINFSQGYKDEIVYGAFKGNEKARELLKNDREVIAKVLEEAISVREARGSNDFIIVCGSGNTQNVYFNKKDKSEFGYKETGFIGWFSERLGAQDDIAEYGSFLSYIDDEEIKEHIIVVGSVGHKESKKKGTTYHIADSSSQGLRVDIMAPGEDIYTTTIGDKYKKNSGTSFAAPHVSGVAAMLYAINPSLSASQVKAIICNSGLETFDVCGKSVHMIDAYDCVKNVLSISKENDVNEKDNEEEEIGDINEDQEEDVDLTDYSIDIDREELSIFPLIISLDYRENDIRNWYYYYDIYDLCHDTNIFRREPKGDYDYLDYYVGFSTADKVKKDDFDSWLYKYFDIKTEELDYEPEWNFVVESDEDYYYFYYEAGYGILYPTNAYIYDIEFSNGEGCFKADLYDDYYSKYKEYSNMSREEFLLDPDNEYLRSYKVYFDIKDGRMLIKGSEILEPDVTIRYLGKASDTKYADYKVLSNVFKKGKEVVGYKYAEYWEASWRKEGWEGYFEYYGADFYPENSDVDVNTDEPIYVCIYPQNEYSEADDPILGYAVFSDLSWITYYSSGKTEIKSKAKELIFTE